MCTKLHFFFNFCKSFLDFLISLTLFIIMSTCQNVVVFSGCKVRSSLYNFKIYDCFSLKLFATTLPFRDKSKAPPFFLSQTNGQTHIMHNLSQCTMHNAQCTIIPPHQHISLLFFNCALCIMHCALNGDFPQTIGIFSARIGKLLCGGPNIAVSLQQKSEIKQLIEK